MSKSVINFWLDVLLLLIFLTLLWSASIVHIVFPAGMNAAGWTLWGWSREQWSDFHFGVLCTLLLAIVIHVMLHWTWVCGIVASKIVPPRDGDKKKLSDGARTLYGVSLLILLLHVLALGVAVAWLTIQPPPV